MHKQIKSLFWSWIILLLTYLMIDSYANADLSDKTYDTNISSYSPKNCGELYLVGGFLIGGEPAKASRWPWIAAMYVKNNYSCTVNFITSSRAVTAAHCFINVERSNDIALLIFTGRYIGVRKYAKHPMFKKEPLYDIAILDTETITDASFIPICLTKSSQSIVGVPGNVLSYTLDSKIGEVDLTQAKFYTVQKRNCQKVFNHVPNHSLCVLHGHKGAYLCHGDSGAGFLTLADNSNYGKDRITLRGIVSTGASDLDGDCTVKDYVIFTDVTKFASFVTGGFEDEIVDDKKETSLNVYERPDVNKKPDEKTEDLSNKCGDPYLVTGYIINGTKAASHLWPWVAAMYVNNKYACSANYISDRIAVTAATCFRSRMSPEDIKLYIFSDEFKEVRKFEKHPRFKKIPEYDIAIVRTDPVRVSGFVPICITDNVDSLLGQRGIIISWAPQKNTNKIELFSAILPVITNDNCEAEIGFTVPNHSFCVNQGKDTWICSGDSGGSFMIKNKEDKRWYLRGIVSTGVTDPEGDCSIGNSVIFTNVEHFYDFVTN